MTLVNTAMDEIAALWEALSPRTEISHDSSITYHHLSDAQEADDATGHRGFWFRDPKRERISGEAAGATAREITWLIVGSLFLMGDEIARKEFREAVMAEGNALAQAANDHTGWSSGILHVQAESQSMVLDLPDMWALVSIGVRVKTEEA